MVKRSTILAEGATRYADPYEGDLIAWAVADSFANDRQTLWWMLAELNGPSIYEQMTGHPV